jgi:hypothetical protein
MATLPPAARQLFAEGTAQMKPLPADEARPVASGTEADDFIVWLAYREAKALPQSDK